MVCVYCNRKINVPSSALRISCIGCHAVYYFKNKILHRSNGPAVECNSGEKVWYIDGLRHREDGPAWSWLGFARFWFIRDKELSQLEWFKEILRVRL